MKRWPLNKAYTWERAPFLRILLPLVAGILLYPFWKGSNAVAMFTALFIYLLFLAAAVYKVQGGLRQIVNTLFLNSFFILIGFISCYFNDVQHDKHWFGKHVNTADLFLVRVKDDPLEKERTQKLSVEVLASVRSGKAIPSSGKAFVYAYKDQRLPELHKGDTLLIPNKWQPVKDSGNPFEFKYAAYCRRNNIHYQQFLGWKDILLKGKASRQDLSYTETVHDWCMSTLQRYITDRQALGLVQSMLIGDEVNLDNETREAFVDTGIVHVIAISGGNIAILFLMVLLLLRWLKHKKYLWLKYLVSLPLVWFYVLMAGGSPSAIRAAIMFSLLALGFVLQKRRDTNSLNHLLATAFILLIAEPVWLYSIGFQLSFIAVLSLILFYRHIFRWYAPGTKLTKALWGTVAASIAAEILIAPLIIYYFHTFPLWFIISNVLAYLLMSIVLILGMSVIGLSFIPAFANLLGVITSAIIIFFNAIINWLRNYEPISLHILRLTETELVFVYIVIAATAVYLLQKKKPAAIVSLFSLCLLITSFCFNRYRDGRQDKLVVYNVGKAYHIEWITGNSFCVIATDTSGHLKKERITKPAHIGWQALYRTKGYKELFSIGGKTAIVLRQPVLRSTDTLHTDFLVIACKVKLADITLLKAAFHPGTVVLSYSLPPEQLNDWKLQCEQEGIKLHAVQDGAFIME